MSGDYYAGPNPLLKGTLNSVERERLREREREARAQMTYEAEQRVPQDVFNSGPLFGEIVRLNPQSNDKERQHIEKKLGLYDEVKILLDQDSTNLYGIDGQPPPSPAPNVNLSSSLNSSLMNVHEFKRPNACSQPQLNRHSHQHHHHHSNSQRGGFVKPADGKPPYGGRGFYPGQPMKHCSSSSNDFRSSGMVPVKGPPLLNQTVQNVGPNGSSINNSNSNHSTSSSSGRSSNNHEFSNKVHQSSRNLPKLHSETRESSLLSSNLNGSSTTASQANVENILNEMTSAVRPPLTIIPPTPRKEMETKYIFNPVSGQIQLPSKPPIVDKNNRANLLKDILAPVTRAPLTSVFRTGEGPLTPFSPPTSSLSALTSTSVPSKTKTTSLSVGSVQTQTTTSTTTTTTLTTSSLKTVSPNLPYLKSVSLSEESEDDEDEDEDEDEDDVDDHNDHNENDAYEEEDDDNNEDSEEENNSNNSAVPSIPNQQEATCPQPLENVTKSEMSQEEERASSSSEDTDTDSCSDSEDSSSDTPSPPSLPLPDLPDQDSKKWNLKNFLPQPTHGNTTPAPQTPQTCENGEKSKTDDSDSSGDTTQKSPIASSSSSESDADSVKSCNELRKSSRAEVTNKLSASEDSSDEDDRNRRKYNRRSSSSSQSSDDSDRPAKVVNNGNSNNSNCSSNNSNNTNANNNSSVTVVGVVRPHQRKPPSPQVFNRNRLSPQPSNEERFGFVPQRSMQISAVPESQCELPNHSDSDGVVGNINRNRLTTETYQSQMSTANISAMKSVEKSSAQPAKSGKGRKPKSPAMVTNEAPVKKKPGRKRKEIPEISDSEDEERKVKVPERKRPGRPPLKRNDSDDVDWNAGPRRKVLDKFPNPNVWGGRERRRSSLRSICTVDSDSDELIAAPVKPTARVIPAIKKKESTRFSSRDSSCESTRNDSDFNIMSNSGGKNNNVTKAEESPPKLDVEGIAVQDKKKSDTLRKLFSRPQEGGGKNGGKGNGGKGKFGVIVVESEERKVFQRTAMSPASTLHRIDRIPDVSRIDIASSLQQQTIKDRISSISRMNDRVPTDVPTNGDSRSTISHHQDRVLDTDSSVPTTPSTSIDLFPKLIYNENGKPSLMCKIDLSKIPYILAKKRSEEIRIKSELSDTRQTMDMQSGPPSLDIVSVPVIEPMSNDDEDNNNVENGGANRKKVSKRHSSKKKAAKRKHHSVKEESPPQIFKSTVLTPSVDPGSDSMSSDVDTRKKASMMVCSTKQRLSMRPPDPMHNIMNSCYPISINNIPQNSLCVERVSDEDPWRSDGGSCSSCSPSPVSCRTDVYDNHNKRSKHHSNRKCRKMRTEHSQRHSSLSDVAPTLMHVPSTNYERVIAEPSLSGYQMNISELVRPMVSHGIYYSYLEHKVSEEINSESDNISPNVYLTEAKRLKYAADIERDKVAQGMQYLEAILSFVLTGYVLERKTQMDTAYSMYSETLKLIVYISKKFRTFCTSAAQSNIPNKIAILSLRCESILNLKLYTMRELEVRDVHHTVTEYFSKPIPGETCLAGNQGVPSPHSPTPSPASSVGSNSSGYSSGDRRTSGIAQCIAVPLNIHQTLHKQHNFYTNLIASFNYWEEADKLIFSAGNKDFFIELDRFCGPLTLHSSLKDLVHYVRVGIQRLKAIISHHQQV